jgi:molybdopterin synthase sulfur carrier subunit
MARVQFTAHLRQQLPVPEVTADGSSVREVLEEVFREHPAVRGFILDDQGAVRKHVAVFLEGRSIADRTSLSDAVGPDAEIYIMQALSGG